jgi:hypothetical protein
MNILRSILLLQFATTLALGQSSPQGKPATLLNQPEALVRSLYTEVVALHPIGIPRDAKMKTFAPYLSKALLHRIDMALACAADYDRQYPDPNLKPPFAWLEAGLFSGDDEQAEPRTFRIERTQSENDGSFRVYVRLSWGVPPEKPLIWRVAAVVAQEDSRFVLNDVIYLKDENREVEGRLSQYLSAGCDGPRWVGHSNPQGRVKQQR